MSAFAIAALMIGAGLAMIVIALVMRASRNRPQQPGLDPALLSTPSTAGATTPTQSVLPLDVPSEVQAPPAQTRSASAE